MYTFDPALMAEIAYRREDVRASFRSSRPFRTRTRPAPVDASTGTRSRLVGGHRTVASRVA